MVPFWNCHLKRHVVSMHALKCFYTLSKTTSWDVFLYSRISWLYAINLCSSVPTKIINKIEPWWWWVLNFLTCTNEYNTLPIVRFNLKPEARRELRYRSLKAGVDICCKNMEGGERSVFYLKNIEKICLWVSCDTLYQFKIEENRKQAGAELCQSQLS